MESVIFTSTRREHLYVNDIVMPTPLHSVYCSAAFARGEVAVPYIAASASNLKLERMEEPGNGVS